jgi:hypothetical protein
MNRVIKILFFLLTLTPAKSFADNIPVVFDLSCEHKLDIFQVYIFDSHDKLIWENYKDSTTIPYKSLSYSNPTYEIILTDTMRVSERISGKYTLKIIYKFAYKTRDSCKFEFTTIDSLPRLCFEVFFDNFILKHFNSSLEPDGKYRYSGFDYEKNLNPKPGLIVIYDNINVGAQLQPVAFDQRDIIRPQYSFLNETLDTLKDNRSLTDDFFGDLEIKDSLNRWDSYTYGGMCGTVNSIHKLAPGESTISVEGYSIGTPLKLKAGFYRYSVNYWRYNQKNSVSSYFRVFYSSNVGDNFPER